MNVFVSVALFVFDRISRSVQPVDKPFRDFDFFALIFWGAEVNKQRFKLISR